MTSKNETDEGTGLARQATCPACGHHVAVAFFNGGRQPLATLAWPRSVEAARSMARLPLDFVRCVNCGHVYNAAFDYAAVPYADNPNLMFNRGSVWNDYLEDLRDRVLEHLPESPTVVEIGCGEGHFLRRLAEARPTGRYIGFDPNGEVDTGDGRMAFHRELFEPERDLPVFRPDLVVSRHVLEHLMNPLGFVQVLAFAVSCHNLPTRLFIEVPCIDRVFASGRTADFYYEHNSHFTTRSLQRMLERSGAEVEAIGHGYDDEVVHSFARFAPQRAQAEIAAEGQDFFFRAERARTTIAAQLAELAESGVRTAIWGGTGKGAAFIANYGADAERFPLVVDSDPLKVGTFVPGAGQPIRFRDVLLEEPATVIIIPTQWRARDIMLEIERTGIVYDRILIEHDGRLIDFLRDPHPY